MHCLTAGAAVTVTHTRCSSHSLTRPPHRVSDHDPLHCLQVVAMTGSLSLSLALFGAVVYLSGWYDKNRGAREEGGSPKEEGKDAAASSS